MNQLPWCLFSPDITESANFPASSGSAFMAVQEAVPLLR